MKIQKLKVVHFVTRKIRVPPLTLAGDTLERTADNLRVPC